MSDSIHVAVRVRPLITRENRAQSEVAWKVLEGSGAIMQADGSGQPYTFDHVFDMSNSNTDVYDNVAAPIINGAMEGFNGTIFAYGQTSSGKTHTMMGTAKEPGVVPRAVQDIFDNIELMSNREFLFRVSYMEIYNENISDLLNSEKRSLRIHEDSEKHVYVSGLTEEVVNSAEAIYTLMKKGDAQRRVGETNMNERSSRSHTIFRVIIESRERCSDSRKSNDGAVNVSHLNLVDLAGSERASQTGATGERLKEGCSINRSLFMLGHVISKLSEGDQFVNFRDSKLTRILQNSLGGNSKTAIICTVTPASIDDTLSTLKFASRAKTITNKPKVNEVLSDEALLRRYRKELNDLKKKLESSGVIEEQKERENLQLRLEEKEKSEQELQDKIDMLMKLICVSSVPNEPQEKPKKKLRRETWCPGNALSRNPLSSAHSLELELQTTSSCLMPPPMNTIAERSFSCSSSFSMKRKSSSSSESHLSDSAFAPIQEDFLAELEAAEDVQRIADGSLEKRKKRRVVHFDDSPIDMTFLGSDVACQTEINEATVYEDKDMEIQMLIKTLNETNEELAEKTRLLEEAGPSQEQTIAQLTKRNAELEAVVAENKMAENKMVENKMADSSCQCKDLQLEVDTLKDLNHDLEERFSQMFDDCEGYKEEVQGLTTKLRNSEAKVSQLRSELEEKCQSGDTNDVEMLQGLIETLHDKVSAYETEVAVLKESLISNDSTKSQEASTSELQKEIVSLNMKIEEQKLEIESLHEVNTHLESMRIPEGGNKEEGETEDLKLEIEALRELVGEYEKQLDRKLSPEPDSDSLLEKARNLETELLTTVQLCEQISSEKTKLEEEVLGLRQDNVNLKAKCEDLKEQNEKKAAELRELHEFTAFEAGLQDLEVQFQDEISGLKKQLEATQKELEVAKQGKSTIDVLDGSSDEELRQKMASLKKSESDAENVLLDVNRTLAEKLDEIAALKQTICDQEVKMKKLEQSQADFDSYLEMERANRRRTEADLRSQLQTTYQENTELQAQLDVDSSQREAQLHTEVKTTREEVVSLSEKLQQAQVDLEEAVDGSLEVNEQLRQCQAELSAKDNEVAALKMEVRNLKVIVEENQHVETAAVNKSVAKSVDETLEFDVTVSSNMAFNSEGQSEALSLQAELQAVQLNTVGESDDDKENSKLSSPDSEEMEATVASLKEQVDSLTARCQELKDNKEQMEAMVDHWKPKVSEMQHQLDQYQALEKESSERGAELGAARAELDAVKAELQEARAKICHLIDSNEELSKRVEETKMSASVADTKVNETTSKIEEMKMELQLAKNELTFRSVTPTNESKMSEQLLNEEKKAYLLLQEKYDKLLSESSQAKGKLLSEVNRDLGHQRQIEELEKAYKELQSVFSQMKKQNNELIESLNKQVYELQCKLQKSEGERELAVHQNSKTSEKLESVRAELRNMETLQSQHAKTPSRQEMDPQKLVQRIKQLEFNLDLTRQKSEKFQQQAKSVTDMENKLDSAQFARNDLQRQVRDLQHNLDLQKEQHQQLIGRFNQSMSQYTNLQQHTNSLQEEVKKIKKEKDNIEKHIDTLSKERSDLLEKVEQLDSSLKCAQSSHVSSDVLSEIQQSHADELQRTVQTEQEKHAALLDAEITRMSLEKEQAFDQKVAALRDQSLEKMREIEADLKTNYEKQAETMKEEISKLSGELKLSQEKLLVAERQDGEMCAKMADAELQLDKWQRQAEELEQKVAYLEEQFSDAVNRLEEAEESRLQHAEQLEATKLQNQQTSDHSSQQVVTLTIELESVKTQLNEAKEEIDNNYKEISHMRECCDQSDKELEAQQTALRQARETITKLELQNQQTSDHSSQQVVTLTTELESVKTQLNEAKEEIDNNHKEISHMRECCDQSDKELEAEQTALRKARETITELELQNQQTSDHSSQQVVTLTTELESVKTQLNEAKEEINNNHKEISHMRECCDQSDKELEAEQTALRKAREAITKLESQLQNQQTSNHSSQQVVTLTTELESVKAQLSEAKKEIDDGCREINHMRECCDQSDKELEAEQTALRKARETITKLEKEKTDWEAEVDKLKQCCEELDQDSQKERLALTKLQKKYDSLHQEVAGISTAGKLQNELGEKDLEINELQRRLMLIDDRYQKKLKSLRDSLQVKEESLVRYKSELRRLQQTVDSQTATVSFKPNQATQQSEETSSGGVASSLSLYTMEAKNAKLQRDLKAARQSREEVEQKLSSYKAKYEKLKEMYDACKKTRPGLEVITNSPKASPVKKLKTKLDKPSYNLFSNNIPDEVEEEPQECTTQ